MAARAPVAQLLAVALVVCAVAASSAGATQFRVGGQSGWSVPGAGAESYNTWAGRLRFQIGDQLLFVYPKETDSVLLVDAAAYNACNTSSYLARFDDGSTVFTFDRSGPFFFVSGNEASCRANEKLIVVVLADRSGTRTPPAAPPGSPPPAAAPAPATSPSSPPSSGAAPVPAPAAATPSPAASAPAPAPSTTPTASAPAPAPSTTPTASAPAPAPTTTPSSPPAPAAPSPSTTPGAGSSPPPSASANAPAGQGGGSTATPPPPSSAAPVVAGLVGTLGAFIGYAMLAV